MSSHKLFKRSFNAGKCKTSLKLATSRMKLLRIKRQEQLKVVKRNLAQILQSGQEQTARARVEHVYREENTIAAYDLLELYCEQIVDRLQIIESQKKCPLDLEEPISSILFASQRCAEIQEFTDVRHHFTLKYGKEFVSAAVELRAGSRVNRTVIEKLSSKTPDGQTKLKMLAAIAKEHNVDWDPHAVEEQISDLPETKFAGPTEFISATNITEFPDVPKHDPGTKVVNHETNIRPPEHPTSAPGTNTSRANSSSQINSRKPSAPDPGTSNANVAPDYRPRAPENVAADPSVDVKYKHEGVLLEKSHWHMNFKDATAAAKAAAESAEKASIAARAAAELSTLEKMSRQNSTESHKSEKDATFQGQVKDNSEENSGRGYDHRNPKATRSKSGSSQSNLSSHDNELLSSGAQWTETPCPSSSQQRETLNKKWQNHENVRENLGEDGSVKKRPSLSLFSDSTYCGPRTETVTESFGGPMAADMQMEGHSSHSPPESETFIMKRLPSESDKYDSHGEGSISESTFTGSKSEVDTVIFSTANRVSSLSSTSGKEIFSRGDTAKSVSTYDSGAVFDNSDSESESYLDLEGAVVESKLDSLVPDARRSSNSVPSTLDPWKSREPGNESLKGGSYTRPSHSTPDVQYRPSSSNRNVKATVPSPYYDPVLSTLDDSDGLDASSEEEANGQSSPVLLNVSSTRDSPPSFHIKHGPVESASYSRNEVREREKKQAPVLHDSDSDDSFGGNTVAVSVYTPGGKSPVRSSISSVKDQKRMNSLEPCPKRVSDLDNVATTTFYTDTGGPEPLVDSDTDSSSILKFDRLGGLRNKGYIRPPYVRHQLRISSSDVNSLTNEENSLANTPEASHTGKTSLILRENQESSKWKESSELKKKKPKSSGHYFDDTDSDSEESVPEGVGHGTRSTISSDFQEQRRISGSKTEMFASVGSGVSMKSRSPEKPSILCDEELTKSLDQDVISDVITQTAFKTKRVLEPSKQEIFSELQRGNDCSGAFYQYCDIDTDKSADAGTSMNWERGSRRTKVSPASVRTAGRSIPFSQPTTKRNPVQGTHVEEQPSGISKTQKMETKTSRRSYDHIDSDSDEPVVSGSPLHQSVVNRHSKASTSYMSTARESPPQPPNLRGPEIVTVDNPPDHSVSVSHVREQSKHRPNTTASHSSKDIEQYGSEVANKSLKPSAARRTLLENKEMKTSRTSYHGFGSDSDKSMETSAHVDIKMVNRNGKNYSLQRTALQDNPPYQPSGASSKFCAKVEVPDSKVSGISLQNQPPETLPKQTKAASSDTSRADVKPSGSIVPTTSRENSFQRANHVHPKLPDYDSLVEMLQAAKREK